MNAIPSKAEKAVEEISESWHSTITSLLNTAQLLLKHSMSSDWRDIQQTLTERNIMKGSVISMMLGIAKNKQLNDSKYTALLPPAYNTLYQLAKLDEKELKHHFKKGDISPSLKLKEVRSWNKSKPSKPNSKRKLFILSATDKDIKRNKNSLKKDLDELKKKYPFLIIINI